MSPSTERSSLPVRIDGSYGEGGGQIIRAGVSLSAITGRPVEITNVRARRARPGLQPQHLTAVRAAAQLCSARVEGDAVGSSRFSFTPIHPPQQRPYRFEIGTAGATPLVIQTVLAPLAHSAALGSNLSARVTVTGGTHVPHAPPAEYLEAVYLPALRRCGIPVEFLESAAGFYPRGGGEIQAQITSPTLQPLNLVERGKLTRLQAFIVTSQLPDHVADRGALAVERFMKAIGRPIEIYRRDLPSNGPGAAVVVTAECEGGHAGFTGIGARGKPMEKVAEEACELFMPWWKSGAACDEHLADQLVLPLLLAPGPSQWTTPRVTEHLRTVLWVASQFLALEFALEEADPDLAGRKTTQQIPALVRVVPPFDVSFAVTEL